MVRTGEETIKIIKDSVGIKQVVTYYANPNFTKNKCVCPLHNEKTPSFFINEEKNVFYCQGCGEGGDQITFVQKYLGISFTDAVNTIDRDFAIGAATKHISVAAQVQMREQKEKREKELRIKEENSKKYDELCSEYMMICDLIKELEPLTTIWGNMLSRKAFIEYNLDKIMEGLL